MIQLGQISQLLAKVLPKKKQDISSGVGEGEQPDLSGFGFGNVPMPPGSPTSAPVADPQRAANQSRLAKQQAKADELIAALLQPAPAVETPRVNPIEQALELLAVTQGGASNAGGAFSLAQQRAASLNEKNQGAYQTKFDAAKTALPYVTQDINNLLDRETSLDQIETRIKQSEIAGQAKQAVAQIKQNKEMRFKIADLVANNKATVPAIQQVLMADGADPDVAEATARALMQDMKTNDQSWYQTYLSDKMAFQQQHITNQDQQATITADVKVLEDLGAGPTLKIAAAGRLIQSGYFPPNSDPLAIANEVSEKAKESQARVALASARTETEKIKKSIQTQLLKQMPQEFADRHAKNLAQIDHWRNMESLEAAGLDFKMKESARDNLLSRYAKTLDSFGHDISVLTNDIISLRDKRKEFEKAAMLIATQANGKAAKAADQPDLDRFRAEIANYDRIVAEKLKIRDALLEESKKVRTKIEDDDAEEEVAKLRTDMPGMIDSTKGKELPVTEQGTPVQKSGSTKPFDVSGAIGPGGTKVDKAPKAGGKGSKWGAFNGG